MEYFIIFIIFLILAVAFDYRRYTNNRKLYFNLECVILILLWGLRYRVGGDSLTYEEEFLYYPSLTEILKGGVKDLPFQPLWYIFNGIIKSITPSFWFFQLVHAIIINTVVFSIINHYCKAKFTATLFYYVFISANMNAEILREALSVCFFLIAFKYMIENKLVKYYLLAIIAMSFHQSAIFLLILPIFKPFFISTWKLKHYIIISVVIIVLGIVAANAIDYLIGINLLGNDFSNDKAIRYYAKAVASQDTNTGFGGSQFGIRFLLRIFLSLYVIFSIKRVKLNTPANNYVVHSYLLLTIMGFILGVIAGRWINYFVVLYYCIIAELLYVGISSRNYMVKIRPLLIVFLYTVLFIFSYTSDSSNGYINSHNEFYRRYYPYHSIFNPQKEPDRENLRYYELYPNE